MALYSPSFRTPECPEVFKEMSLSKSSKQALSSVLPDKFWDQDDGHVKTKGCCIKEPGKGTVQS
jgi:hypothetical protein